MTLAAIPTPEVDWYALAPLVILLGGSCLCVLAAVLLPESWRLPVGGRLAAAGSFVGAALRPPSSSTTAPTPESIVAGAVVRDRLGSLAGLILCGIGLRPPAWPGGTAFAAISAEYYALLAGSCRGHGLPRPGERTS